MKSMPAETPIIILLFICCLIINSGSDWPAHYLIILQTWNQDLFQLPGNASCIGFLGGIISVLVLAQRLESVLHNESFIID